MAFEFDHLFILTPVGAEEAAARLLSFGLLEGAPNTHPGQGTACRRFFFRNFYLELLWVSNPAEAQSTMVQPTHLYERWSRRDEAGICPFGFAYRPAKGHDGGLPFQSWEYRPPYLPPPACIHVGTNADALAEPMLLYLPFAQRPSFYPSDKRQPTEHNAEVRVSHRAELVGPVGNQFSPALQTASDKELLELRAGSEYVVEIGLDGEAQDKHEDFRPALPLLFHW